MDVQSSTPAVDPKDSVPRLPAPAPDCDAFHFAPLLQQICRLLLDDAVGTLGTAADLLLCLVGRLELCINRKDAINSRLQGQVLRNGGGERLSCRIQGVHTWKSTHPHTLPPCHPTLTVCQHALGGHSDSSCHRNSEGIEQEVLVRARQMLLLLLPDTSADLL